MADSILTDNETGLAYYLRNEIYDPWSTERKRLLEGKWQKNLDGFNAISTGFWKHEEADGWRSGTFIKLIKTKVMTAWATVVDMLLQGGKIPITYIPSPWDNVKIEDLSEEEQKFTHDSIEDMTSLVQQQMLDCKADMQVMKVALSGGIYGEYYGKRFVQEIERSNYAKADTAPEYLEDPNQQYTRYEKQTQKVVQPAWEYKSVWSMFRDLESDDMQANAGVIEKDMISPYELRQKLKLPFFIPEAVERAIKEAPGKGTTEPADAADTQSLPPGMRDIDHRFKTIEYLEFWGRVPRKLVELFEAELDNPSNYTIAQDLDDDGDEIECMVALAGQEVVRYARTIPGERPYYRGVWEEHLDHVDGTGVADNLEDIQLVLNGLIRAYEDNTKLSANVMTISQRNHLGQWDGKFKPGLDIEASEAVEDVRKAIQQLIIAPVGDSVLKGIDLFSRLGDEDSMLPKIMQGDVAEKRKPDTLGELQLLYESAGKYLGAVIKNFDNYLFEPLGRDFYEYNMEDPNVDPKVKANLIAKALGFTSFQNKVVRVQALMTFLNLAFSNEGMAGEVKIRDIMEEIAKGTDLEPSQVLKSKEEKEAEFEQQKIARAEEAQQGAQVAEMIKEIETKFLIAIEEAKAENALAKQEEKHDDDIEMEVLEHDHDMQEKELEGAISLQEAKVKKSNEAQSKKSTGGQ